MMDTRILVKPVRVSPFIKLARWSLLIYGIFYGNLKWHYLHKVQTEIREEREKIRPMLEAQARARKLEETTASLREVAEGLGIELPPDWKAIGF